MVAIGQQPWNRLAQPLQLWLCLPVYLVYFPGTTRSEYLLDLISFQAPEPRQGRSGASDTSSLIIFAIAGRSRIVEQRNQGPDCCILPADPTMLFIPFPSAILFRRSQFRRSCRLVRSRGCSSILKARSGTRTHEQGSFESAAVFPRWYTSDELDRCSDRHVVNGHLAGSEQTLIHIIACSPA